MPQTHRQLQNTRVACNTCRNVRTRCDGLRPACSRCTQRQSRCVYETAVSSESRRASFRRSLKVHDQLFEDLRSSLQCLREASDPDALEALRQITSSRDPLGGLAEFGGLHRISITPSAHDLNGYRLSNSYLPFQYDLMMQHPNAYPVVQSLAHVDGDISALELPHKRIVVTNPLRFDPRFAAVRIGRWTTVRIGDHDAARAIAHYLEVDHPVLGLFDADLFMESLGSGSQDFCSAFLVNTVLLWSCMSCSSIDHVAASFKPAFFREAFRIWYEVCGDDNILTVAASQLLSLACACEGDDVSAQSLNDAGYQMGERLGLLAGTLVPEDKSQGSLAHLRSRAQVAWGLFNWLSLHAFYYRQPPLGEPPSLFIPGDQPEDTNGIDADTTQTQPVPLSAAPTFTSLCKFWRILRPVIQSFLTFTHDHSDSQQMSIALAEHTFQNLLSWADDSLPNVSESGTLGQPHHVLVMHIWFHTAIMEIFRPFYGKQLTLSSFRARHSTPEIVFWSSLTQLECLAFQYRQHYSSARTSILWHLSLLFIGNAVVRNPIGPAWRFNFLLCMNSYVDLAGSFRLADGLLRAILYMAVQRKLISSDEAREIVGRVPVNGANNAAGTSQKTVAVKSGHVVDLDLAVENQSLSQVTSLAGKLDDALMFDEFVVSEQSTGNRESAADHQPT